MHKETEVDASVRKDKCKKRLQGEPLLWVRSFPKIYGQDIRKNKASGVLTLPG